MIAIGMTGNYSINSVRVIIILLDVLNNNVTRILKTAIGDMDSIDTTYGITKCYCIPAFARPYVEEINLEKVVRHMLLLLLTFSVYYALNDILSLFSVREQKH